tara:strand:+ start:237 stop:473 length:237 start_codon:yes stop_codon:yes gene_type:complete
VCPGQPPQDTSESRVDTQALLAADIGHYNLAGCLALELEPELEMVLVLLLLVEHMTEVLMLVEEMVLELVLVLDLELV